MVNKILEFVTAFGNFYYLDGEWEGISVNIEIPSTATGFHMYMYLESLADLNDAFYCDKYKIEDITLMQYNYVPDYRHQNLIDHGNCESDTPPVMFNEVTSAKSNCTFLRSGDFAADGIWCYKYVNTNGGVDNWVTFVDTLDTDNMHGLIPGLEYELSIRLRIPSGGITGSEIKLSIFQYIVSWGASQGTALNVYDDWQTVTATLKFNSLAIGVLLRIDPSGS